MYIFQRTCWYIRSDSVTQSSFWLCAPDLIVYISVALCKFPSQLLSFLLYYDGDDARFAVTRRFVVHFILSFVGCLWIFCESLEFEVFVCRVFRKAIDYLRYNCSSTFVEKLWVLLRFVLKSWFRLTKEEVSSFARVAEKKTQVACK